jgi:hypothetical protein
MQVTHQKPGNSQAQLTALNQEALMSEAHQQKYFGRYNRVLLGEMADNVPLVKSLNYQVPIASGQQILDVIPSVNSEFSLVTKPNGVVQLYSSSINMSDVKQIIMFTNDGDKVNTALNYSIKKLRAKQLEQVKVHKQALENSSDIKLLSDGKAVKKKKTKSLEKSLSKSEATTDLHSKKKAPKGKKKFGKSKAELPDDEEEDLQINISKKKSYKEDDAFDLILEAENLEEDPSASAAQPPKGSEDVKGMAKKDSLESNKLEKSGVELESEDK